MKWILVVLALTGIIVASLALHERYNTGASPCKINPTWDCGEVNHSQYALFHGVPVAVIGILGYVLLGALALGRAWRFLLPSALIGLLFSLYLTRIEAHTLQVWCIYCVFSLGIISLITVLALVAVLVPRQTTSTS